MASVRKLDNGRYQGVARHPSGRRSTKVFRLQKQALSWAEETEAAWRKSGFRDPRAGLLTLGDWYTLWLPARTVADTTRAREIRTHRLHVLPQWEKWPLATITRIEIRAWVARMAAQGTSAAQIHAAFWALSAMLRDAVAEDPPLLLANPCNRIPLPALPTPTTRFFTAEEVGRILVELPEPWRTMVELAVWTGLRWEELAGLHGTAVDWLRCTVHVASVRTPFGDRPYPKSEKSRRVVPAPSHVVEAMGALMVGRSRDARMFEHRGKPPIYQTWNWNFRRACERAGVDYAPPHTLRHTCASWLAQAGVDQYRIAALLGHSSPRITARYSHLAPEAHERIREVWRTVPEFRRRSSAEEGTE